jgi:hypothetical protein
MKKALRLSLLSLFFALASCRPLALQPLPEDPAASRAIPAFEVPPIKPGVAYQRFIAMGDWGTGRPDQLRVAAAMAERAKKDTVDFLLTVGDNFYEDGVTSADDPQWKEKFEDVYADPALRLPIYVSLGNHDYRGKIQAQIEYGKTHKNWILPSAYYTFTRTFDDGTAVQFFALDTVTIVGDESATATERAQLDWLDSELGKSTARWKIVFGHRPLYSNTTKARAAQRKVMIDAVESLFTRHHVDVYLAGHDHSLEMLKPVKGVHYVITGGGAGPDKAYAVEWTDASYYAATLGGFTLCRISRDELVIEFVRLDATTQYAYTITK